MPVPGPLYTTQLSAWKATHWERVDFTPRPVSALGGARPLAAPQLLSGDTLVTTRRRHCGSRRLP
jgi:hypothetical protein